jgi:hypothetical protein
MNQQSPLYVRMPDAQMTDEDRVSGAQWLVVVTVLVTIGTFIALYAVHDKHAFHGDRAGTPEFAQCLSDQMDEFVRTGIPQDSDACKPVMPWYAAHPFWYALIVGAAVFVVGRVALFMVRMERARGY